MRTVQEHTYYAYMCIMIFSWPATKGATEIKKINNKTKQVIKGKYSLCPVNNAGLLFECIRIYIYMYRQQLGWMQTVVTYEYKIISLNDQQVNSIILFQRT